MPESRGLAAVVRPSDTSIFISMALFDGSDAAITSAATVRMWHLDKASDDLESYDFDDDTFKTSALTTATTTTTHQTVENGSRNTGIHTFRHTTLSAFTAGDEYIVEFSHASLARPNQVHFQYGFPLPELTGDAGDTPEMLDAIMLLYMALRNNSSATATSRTIADSTGTAIATATVTASGTTFSQGKLA